MDGYSHGMRMTVLGGRGAWPAAGQACSGYLVEHDGFRLLLDPGYAILPRLLETVEATQIDAVLVSHGHPDHCADLNPLLRARVLRPDPPAALPVYTLPGSLEAVLALDRPGMLDSGYELHDLGPGEIGPFTVDTRMLPHSVPNAGVRLTAGGATLAYTGDTGPSPEIARLAGDAGVLLADASFVDEVAAEDRPYLGSAGEAARQATVAGVGRLVLAHLLPGTDPAASRSAAAAAFTGPIDVATGGLVIEI
jgi:ribonuclease BN (tRNA processing enzyme)